MNFWTCSLFQITHSISLLWNNLLTSKQFCSEKNLYLENYPSFCKYWNKSTPNTTKEKCVVYFFNSSLSLVCVFSTWFFSFGDRPVKDITWLTAFNEIRTYCRNKYNSFNWKYLTTYCFKIRVYLIMSAKWWIIMFIM